MSDHLDAPGMKPPNMDARVDICDISALGKAILIGLELLVAADIIRSVAISPSFATIGVLGMIVVIRTFLSWSLELEINGSWPWQGSRFSDDVEPRHF